MSTSTQLHALISRTLATRTTDRQMRASVEAAIHPGTEHSAYPWVLPYASDIASRPVFLRAAAITARHTSAAQKAGVPLGRSLRNLTAAVTGTSKIDPGKPDSVATKLITLVSLDLDEAADLISQLVGQAGKHKIGFDYHAIADTLHGWGDGIDDQSVATRHELLAEYYSV